MSFLGRSRAASSAVGSGNSSNGGPKASSLSLAGLPPDLIIRIFTFLPVPDLPHVAAASRRLKILAYNDDVYKPKLRVLGVMSADDATPPPTSEEDAETAAVNKLSSRLKQLPGGNMLPGSTKYLETGTLWGGLDSTASRPDIIDDSSAETAVAEVKSGVTSSSGASVESDLTNSDSGVAVDAGASSASPAQKITAGIPQMKKSNLIVGAGGIKTLGRSPSGLSIGGGSSGAGASRFKSPGLKGVRPRDAFKAIYTELSPYYLDFRGRQKDSKVFKENKDLVHIAILLRRIRLLSQAKFILDTDDVNFSLETTIEWFESMLLGQFERAYDAKNIVEMKRNAMANYELNGGAACVQLFISKNPIFFDHTFNPSLVASKLPSGASSDPKGYALADEFAKFMDHMLSNCKTQAGLVAKVFCPEMDTMTVFVSKVFEDSITEYLTAVVKTAKKSEALGIYLHTLATAVHCCTQFLDFIQIAEPGVTVHTDKIRKNIAAIFKPYAENYMSLELEFLGKKIDFHLQKWKKRNEKRRMSEAASPITPTTAGFLMDAEAAQAHKRQVLNTMKSVLYAPMALGQSLFFGRGLKGQDRSLLEGAEVRGGEGGEKPGDEMDESIIYPQLDDDSLGSMVSLELCLNLIHANKESLGRVLVITSAVDSSQLKANTGKIFIKLVQAIGEGHMYPAFRSAIDRLAKSFPVDDWSDGHKAVNADSLQFFELVHIADLIHQMVDVYFAEDVKPWIDEHDFLSDVMIEKKTFDRTSDDNVAHGMDKAIQVLINQADWILIKSQAPTDYNPRGDNPVFDLRPSKACRDVVACLNAHTRLLNGVTNKDTLEVFFGEVGVRLFNVITKNIKKNQVSQTGAMQLICDLNRYYEWASNLRVGSVARLFLVLKELGNLFLADGGQQLKDLVHDAERYQGALRPEEIYELLASRTDYKKIQKHVESKECIVM